jgi:hypothetical protein
MKLAFSLIQQAPVANAAAPVGPAHVQQDDGEQHHHSPSAEQVLAAASGLGIDRMRYARFAAIRWGPDWGSQAECRREALDQIGRYRRDPEGLIDKIEVELCMAEREQR